jgi:hypothetical protein
MRGSGNQPKPTIPGSNKPAMGTKNTPGTTNNGKINDSKHLPR